MLLSSAELSKAMFAKTMRSRAVKFEENLIDNDNWRHGVKYILSAELLPTAILFALKNSSDHYKLEIHTSVRHSDFSTQCSCTF